ncbi:hypothetical protein [Flavobacterium haoranii]|uniref:Uncharacterized protein n=1 Tax=Flavobacterium haoranii TaxID=683124 RepID=A0A1M6LF70_9FLAO|nr:hypothetical protein [Flavobacterium haoranii]SHJ69883.1 hypothetical protein SAMN05444337_2476 [Flavobacterium haoranii]
MKKSNIEILENRIMELEAKQKNDLLELKNEIEITYESLKPIHLITDFLENNLISKKILKSNLFKVGLSSIGSYLLKKTILKKSNSFIRILSANALQKASSSLIENFLKN